MCGIIGYVGKKNNALDVIIEGLLRLEYRGYDSAGIAYVKDGLLNIVTLLCRHLHIIPMLFCSIWDFPI